MNISPCKLFALEKVHPVDVTSLIGLPYTRAMDVWIKQSRLSEIDFPVRICQNSGEFFNRFTHHALLRLQFIYQTNDNLNQLIDVLNQEN